MGRQVSYPISPNPDINENREIGLDLIEKHKKTPYYATKADLKWFWTDLDMGDSTELLVEYVEPRLKELSDKYPFQVTEWFEEFYRFMPELLPTGIDKTGEIDWNIFFSLAYPLPSLTCISFRGMIKRLDVEQNRIVRKQIKEEVWENIILRKKVLRGELIPSVYTYYISYQTLRNSMIGRQDLEFKRLEREKRRAMEAPGLKKDKLFRKVLKLQEEGYEVLKIEDNQLIMTKEV